MMNSSEIMSMMEFLKWKEVSTKRQRKNGTQIFELPIKGGRGCTNIKVGSFKSGYVRRMNHCYTPYQLNKCKPTVDYYPEWKWIYDKDGQPNYQIKTGKYRKYTGKQRIVIPDEVDRLNYLISYCLKNFYIGYANQVADGKFIPKWEHEWKLKQAKEQHKHEVEQYSDYLKNLSVTVNGQRYKVI
jgi:hypothetical protein